MSAKDKYKRHNAIEWSKQQWDSHVDVRCPPTSAQACGSRAPCIVQCVRACECVRASASVRPLLVLRAAYETLIARAHAPTHTADCAGRLEAAGDDHI
jgi:hypothetical protein